MELEVGILSFLLLFTSVSPQGFMGMESIISPTGSGNGIHSVTNSNPNPNARPNGAGGAPNNPAMETVQNPNRLAMAPFLGEQGRPGTDFTRPTNAANPNPNNLINMRRKPPQPPMVVKMPHLCQTASWSTDSMVVLPMPMSRMKTAVGTLPLRHGVVTQQGRKAIPYTMGQIMMMKMRNQMMSMAMHDSVPMAAQTMNSMVRSNNLMGSASSPNMMNGMMSGQIGINRMNAGFNMMNNMSPEPEPIMINNMAPMPEPNMMNNMVVSQSNMMNNMATMSAPNMMNNMEPMSTSNMMNNMAQISAPNMMNNMAPMPEPNVMNNMVLSQSNTMNGMAQISAPNMMNNLAPMPEPNMMNNMVVSQSNMFNNMAPMPEPNMINNMAAMSPPHIMNNMAAMSTPNMMNNIAPLSKSNMMNTLSNVPVNNMRTGMPSVPRMPNTGSRMMNVDAMGTMAMMSSSQNGGTSKTVWMSPSSNTMVAMSYPTGSNGANNVRIAVY